MCAGLIVYCLAGATPPPHFFWLRGGGGWGHTSGCGPLRLHAAGLALPLEPDAVPLHMLVDTSSAPGCWSREQLSCSVWLSHPRKTAPWCVVTPDSGALTTRYYAAAASARRSHTALPRACPLCRMCHRPCPQCPKYPLACPVQCIKTTRRW
jgi:hypothetical protein